MSDEKITLREARDRMTSGTVILNVTFHQPGMTRPGDLSEVETTADKAMLSLSKTLVRSRNYVNMGRASMYCHDELRQLRIPSSVLRRGSHKVAVDCLDRAVEIVKKYEAEFMEAAEKFADEWPTLLETAKDRLQGQFKLADYPTVEHVRNASWVEYYLTEQNTPKESKLGADLYNREKQKAENRAQREVVGCVQAMRVALKEVLDKFATSLGTRSDGRKRAVTDKGYAAAVEFLELFKNRNVLGDSDAQLLADQALRILDGAEPETLRTDDQFRSDVRRQTEELTKSLDQFIEDGPSRMFDFS